MLKFLILNKKGIMFDNYIKYLNMLNGKLEKFFQKQKPYIFCKKGCAKCCKNAQFPYTQIEFEYLILGYQQLSDDTKNQICSNVIQVLSEKLASGENKFIYKCPFLIENVCSLYDYRGIMCRTFGLLNAVGVNGSDVPFCALEGLNYSNVYDTERKMISTEMFKKLNIKEEPVAFNIQYDFLTHQEFGDGYGFRFGETKPLINWIEESDIFSHICDHIKIQ